MARAIPRYEIGDPRNDYSGSFYKDWRSSKWPGLVAYNLLSAVVFGVTYCTTNPLTVLIYHVGYKVLGCWSPGLLPRPAGFSDSPLGASALEHFNVCIDCDRRPREFLPLHTLGSCTANVVGNPVVWTTRVPRSGGFWRSF